MFFIELLQGCSIPELMPDAIPPPAFPATRIGFLHDLADPTPGLPDLEVAHPDLEELFTVEKMIRRSALKGDGGFALDEFQPNGLFNRNLFKTASTVVFRGRLESEGTRLTDVGHSSDEKIVAAAIFGASNVCRSATPELACLYVIVDPLIRCVGIGRAVQAYMERFVLERGFKGVLSDIFATNKAGISMSMNAGYIVTGSLPNCGYIKGKGMTNSLLVYKRFDDSFWIQANKLANEGMSTNVSYMQFMISTNIYRFIGY